MSENRKSAVEQLESLGLSHRNARKMIRGGDMPDPLTDDILENLKTLIGLAGLSAVEEKWDHPMEAFVKRPAGQVRFMVQVPELYDFSPEERERYYSDIAACDIRGDLRAEIDEDLAPLVPESADRERIYREMYLNGAWWDGEYLRKILKILRRVTTDPARMNGFLINYYYTVFSYYSDAVGCVGRLEQIFRPECIQEILESDPLLPRVFSPHFEPFLDPEGAVRKLTERFPEYLRHDA